MLQTVLLLPISLSTSEAHFHARFYSLSRKSGDTGMSLSSGEIGRRYWSWGGTTRGPNLQLGKTLAGDRVSPRSAGSDSGQGSPLGYQEKPQEERQV